MALTPGTYYCLSSGRTDASITIRSDKSTVDFYKVYFPMVSNHINGSGSHTYTGTSSFSFYATSWTYSDGTSGSGGQIAVSVTLVDGEFLMVNGEIYSMG